MIVVNVGNLTSRSNLCYHHQIFHTGGPPYDCSACGNVILLSQALLSSTISPWTKALKCSECEKSFFISNNVYNHQRVHTGEGLYECSVVGRLFSETLTFIVIRWFTLENFKKNSPVDMFIDVQREREREKCTKKHQLVVCCTCLDQESYLQPTCMPCLESDWQLCGALDDAPTY